METYEYNVSHITGGYDKSTVSLDDIYQMICDASLDMVCGDSEIKPFITIMLGFKAKAQFISIYKKLIFYY